jgi:hypothetical protein
MDAKTTRDADSAELAELLSCLQFQASCEISLPDGLIFNIIKPNCLKNF